uniref:Uncharacterized protein n=1 Tax=Arundo donax TaxID=35708 RepID=A0A0A8ZI64_ARUDO
MVAQASAPHRSTLLSAQIEAILPDRAPHHPNRGSIAGIKLVAARIDTLQPRSMLLYPWDLAFLHWD